MTCCLDPKPKSEKSTKFHQYENSTNVYQEPGNYTKLYEPTLTTTPRTKQKLKLNI